MAILANEHGFWQCVFLRGSDPREHIWVSSVSEISESITQVEHLCVYFGSFSVTSTQRLFCQELFSTLGPRTNGPPFSRQHFQIHQIHRTENRNSKHFLANLGFAISWSYVHDLYRSKLTFEGTITAMFRGKTYGSVRLPGPIVK